MLASFIITFREALEALLIIFIIISYLKRRGENELIKVVIVGAIAALLSSIVIALLTFAWAVNLNKTVFEIVGSFIAVPILTSVIYWMIKEGPRIRSKIKERIDYSIKTGKLYLGLISLSFITIFREAIETLLFNFSFYIRVPLGTVNGVLVGIAAGSALSLTIVYYTRKFNLRKFFYITSILLVFIAGGILGYGVHELIEYIEENSIVELSIWSENVYALSISESNLFHEKNIIGSVLSVMFGYTTRMELLRFLIQIPYIMIALYIILRAYRQTGKHNLRK